ncbi:MAG: ABC transporter permease [Thermoproteota archaeon]
MKKDAVQDFILELKVSTSTAKKELLMNFRYPLWVIFWAIMPVFWLAPLIFQGQALIGGRSSSSFAALSGNSDFVTFNIVGSSLYAYVMSALWGMGLSLRREQWSGTLETVMVSPCNKFFILLGKAASDSLLTTFYAVVQFILASLLFGAKIKLENLTYAILVLLLMIFALYGVGFLLSGIILMYKEPGALLNFVNTFISIICPVNYPLKALVFVFESIGYYLLITGLLFPLTPALEVIRALLLPSFDPFIDTTLALIYLAVVSVVLLFLGTFLFNHVERKARKAGTLGTY